jgi:hypothetical protein
METTRIYKSTEMGGYWEVREIEKPYNVGQNTGLYVSLQMISTSDFKNPLDVMSKDEYEEKGYEGFTCFVYSEGIDEAAEANEFKVVGDSDSSLVPDEVKLARKGFYKSHYDIDL